jgi:hypothetical protein
LSGESGPIDQAVLLLIHDHVPDSLTGFSQTITNTGSWRVLFPFAAIATAVLLGTKRRSEALLMAVSVASGAVLVYVAKALAGRARPALWDTLLVAACLGSFLPLAISVALEIHDS